MTSNGSELRLRCTFESRRAPRPGATECSRPPHKSLSHGLCQVGITPLFTQKPRAFRPPASPSLHPAHQASYCVPQLVSGMHLLDPVQRPCDRSFLGVPKATCLRLPSLPSCNLCTLLSLEGTCDRVSPPLPVLVLPYPYGPGTILQRSPL